MVVRPRNAILGLTARCQVAWPQYGPTQPAAPFLAEGPGNEGMREPDGASVRGLPHSGGSSQLLLTPSPSYHRKVPSLTFLPHGGATVDPGTSHLLHRALVPVFGAHITPDCNPAFTWVPCTANHPPSPQLCQERPENQAKHERMRC